MSETDSTVPTKIVLYTDGGFKPLHNVAGWGLHGYKCELTPAKSGTGNPKAHPTESGYVTGASGKPPVTVTTYFDGFGGISTQATNNVAEVAAVAQALNIAIRHKSDLYLLSDSQYALNGLTKWADGWQRSGWKSSDGSEVKNRFLWEDILSKKQEMQELNLKLETEWVKGHSGILGNELADAHATRGCLAARNHYEITDITTSPAKGYWNTAVDRNRLLNLPKWYFGLSTRDNDGLPADHPARKALPKACRVYYMADPGKEVETSGKPISDASYAVVYSTRDDPVMELLRRMALSMARGDYQGIVVAHMAELMNKEHYQELLNYGERLILKDARYGRLLAPNGELLAQEIVPAFLTHRAVDAFTVLQDRLDGYLRDGVGDTHMVATDIRSVLFDYAPRTKRGTAVAKLRPEFGTGVKSFKVNVGYQLADGKTGQREITLTFGLDLPDRNALAALAESISEISVLTWPESSAAFRTAVFLSCAEGCGIWSGIFSNLTLVP